MGNSIEQGVDQGGVAPVMAQAAREVGGWGGAIVGAKIGAGVGTLAGITTGPGAILFGIGGAAIFGTAGYIGADWVTKYIQEK
ncbi:MAG: hypothetical protein LBK60_11960 [Verrucomicrobiales bacterium]|jgi:hypothetical protein|nr:hypothetical protein [Verrucomicrobiales bacterium]